MAPMATSGDVVLNFLGQDVKNVVFPKVQHGITNILTDRNINIKVILAIKTLCVFDILEIDPLTEPFSAEQERIVQLLKLIQNREAADILRILQALCNLVGMPNTKKRFRDLFANEFGSCIRPVYTGRSNIPVPSRQRVVLGSSNHSITETVASKIATTHQHIQPRARSLSVQEINTQGTPILAIDFGTSTSAIAVYCERKLKVIKIEGHSTIPSFVSVSATAEVKFGQHAKEDGFVNIHGTFFDIKLMLGQSYDVFQYLCNTHVWPFRFEEGKMKQVLLLAAGQRYSPEDLASLLLTYLKTIAEKACDMEIQHAVMTIPTEFNDSQKDATKKAAHRAGIKHVQLITEPYAAALDHCCSKPNLRNRIILIVDFGGGTCDVAVANVASNKVKILAERGDKTLGGNDFDIKLTEYFFQKIKKKAHINICKELRAPESCIRLTAVADANRIRNQAEKVKISLSTETSTFFILHSFRHKTFKFKFTREKFETIAEDLFNRTKQLIIDTVKAAGSCENRIQEVITVGGSSKMPKLAEIITELFPQADLTVSDEPEITVCRGAAWHAKNFGIAPDGLVMDGFQTIA